jgi:hypothetical protein
MDELYIYLQSKIYYSVYFRNFIISTHPLWDRTCHVMAWIIPVIFIALAARNLCLFYLLGILAFTFFMYLKDASYCFVLQNHCNTNDVALFVYYYIGLAAVYNLIIIVPVKLFISMIQSYRRRRK